MLFPHCAVMLMMPVPGQGLILFCWPNWFYWAFMKNFTPTSLWQLFFVHFCNFRNWQAHPLYVVIGQVCGGRCKWVWVENYIFTFILCTTTLPFEKNYEYLYTVSPFVWLILSRLQRHTNATGVLEWDNIPECTYVTINHAYFAFLPIIFECMSYSLRFFGCIFTTLRTASGFSIHFCSI